MVPLSEPKKLEKKPSFWYRYTHKLAALIDYKGSTRKINKKSQEENCTYKSECFDCFCAGEPGSRVRPQQSQRLHYLWARNQTKGSGQDRGHPAAIQLQRGTEPFTGAQRSEGSAAYRNTRPTERPAQDRRNGSLCFSLCEGRITGNFLGGCNICTSLWLNDQNKSCQSGAQTCHFRLVI